MRIEDLHHEELLEFDSNGGIIRFAGQRALLFDAVAMGLLRKYLVDNFGLTAARTLLTQFGFAHGWRMAEAVRDQFTWDDERDWQNAGTLIPAMEGLFHVEKGSSGPLSAQGVLIGASYEGEQHVLHCGRSDVPVCWTICGLLSGYLSRSVGREIFVLEDRCIGAGAATCHLFGRTRVEWGTERVDELHFFEPMRMKDCLDVSLQRVIETLKLAERKLHKNRTALLRAIPGAEGAVPGIVSQSAAMARVVDLARRVAKVDSTVLITGESGVGKERVARLIHDESTRAAGPFVAINCGAMTETLLESELFGHARGSFTGATHDRPGLFESANGGTLLLDEVGELSPAMQVKLLRTLQEREVRRVGENSVRRVDVRVLAATNRDLLECVSAASFRQDLYYRLKVVEVRIPPLRERRDDMLPLARLLLTEAASRMNREIDGLTPKAADQILRHVWPGNVRELENAMERAAALARGNRVEVDDLPEEVRHAPPQTVVIPGAVRPLGEIEKDYILSALDSNGGNQTETAAQLRIGTATLYRKLKSYGLLHKPLEPWAAAHRRRRSTIPS